MKHAANSLSSFFSMRFVALLACFFLANKNAQAFVPSPTAFVPTMTTTTIIDNLPFATSFHEIAQIADTNDYYASSSLWVSVGTGKIDWSNPVEAVVGGITLLYFAFSIWAGIKYFIKDGWRPKL